MCAVVQRRGLSAQGVVRINKINIKKEGTVLDCRIELLTYHPPSTYPLPGKLDDLHKRGGVIDDP
jgi:hypothetical protein